MFNKQSVSLEWAGRTLTIETGQVARQADGAVMVTYGDTTVLATACFAKSAKPGQDFFPLTVNYMEKYYASGRIPGGFFKREGRPTEKETLTSRLIDRPIRPLFVKGFKNEVQVVLTCMSYDLENDPDILGMIGASAALVLSGAPFMGPAMMRSSPSSMPSSTWLKKPPRSPSSSKPKTIPRNSQPSRSSSARTCPRPIR